MYDKEVMQEYQKRYWDKKPIEEKQAMARRINQQRKQRRHDRKRKAIQLKGGKCQKCGYDKCIAALAFHHRDPSTKDTIKTYDAKESLWARKWSFILKEIEKCDLLCANCHMEEHYLDS